VSRWRVARLASTLLIATLWGNASCGNSSLLPPSFRFPLSAGGTSLTIGSPHAVGGTSRRGVKRLTIGSPHAVGGTCRRGVKNSSDETPTPLLIVHPDPGTPLVALEVWVRAGSAYETPETAGAAHLLEHLIFKGTPHHPAGTLDATVEAAGGILEASTEREWTRYRTAVLPDHWEQVLRMLLEHLLHPALPESALQRERALMLQDEYALYQADSFRTVRDALYAQAYGAHPYAFPPFGTPQSLATLSRAQLLDFHRRFYRPDRMVIVAVGNVSPERVQQIVQQVCRQWSDGSDKSDRVRDAPTPTRVSLAPHRALFALGVPAPPATSPEAMLAAEIVRLALTEPHRGLLYEPPLPFLHLQSEYLPRAQPSLMLFVFQLPSETGDKEQVRQRWEAAVRQIIEGRARPQLEQARQWLLARHQQAMRNPLERARLYGLYATLGLPTLPDEYLQRVQALTLDQIEQVAQQMEQAERAVWHSERTTRLERVETSPPSPPMVESQPFRQVLPNRMRVIALRQPGAKQVVMQLLVATGPDAERDFPAGTGELTARMLFTTTSNETQATLASRIARSGGTLQLHYEPIGVRITAIAEPATWENVLALLREGLTRAEFEPDVLQRALQAAQAERQRTDGTHELSLYDALLRQMTEGGTLYARTEELQQVRLEHIRAFYARYYRPERFVLVIAGDIPVEQLTERVQRYWASVSQVIPITKSNFTETQALENPLLQVPPTSRGNRTSAPCTVPLAPSGEPNPCTVPLAPSGEPNPCTVPLAPSGEPNPCTVPLAPSGEPNPCTVPLALSGEPNPCTVPLAPSGEPNPCTVPLAPSGEPNPCTVPLAKRGEPKGGGQWWEGQEGETVSTTPILSSSDSHPSPSHTPTLYLGFGLCLDVRSPEEYAALLTLHALLCEGKRSLLFQHFREAQGIGYAFGGLPIVWQGKGFLLGFLQVGHTRLAQRDTLLQQMETMVRTAALKPEALQRAVALVEGRWRRDALDLFERTRRLALAEASGIGYLAEQNLPERLKQVSEATLQSLLERCLPTVRVGVK
jgi:zinc protease